MFKGLLFTGHSVDDISMPKR